MTYTKEQIVAALERALADRVSDVPILRSLAGSYPKLVEDAARYRYLRAQPMKDGWSMVNVELMYENEDGPTGAWYNYENESLDAAIDAARNKP